MADPHSHYSAVRLQQGRVELDADSAEGPALYACGLYRSTVVTAQDPIGQQRLEIELPAVLGGVREWAVPCQVGGGPGSLIVEEGLQVWIAFKEGDVERPVWLGRVL